MAASVAEGTTIAELGLYNNRIGRDLEQEFRDDPRPAEDIVMEALQAGRLQTRPFSLSR